MTRSIVDPRTFLSGHNNGLNNLQNLNNFDLEFKEFFHHFKVYFEDYVIK